MLLAQEVPVPKKTRILLVDDEPQVLSVIKRRLERAGHDVLACWDGTEAIALLAEQVFDVMVSDIEMPGVSGLKLLRAVREHDLDLPVVLMTGNPGLDTATDALEYGAFRYLIKPVPFDELNAVVKRAANVAQMAAQNGNMWKSSPAVNSGLATEPAPTRCWIARFRRCGWRTSPSSAPAIRAYSPTRH